MRAYERLLEYVKINTTSSKNRENCPSTPNQLKMAQILFEEMKEIGIEDARVDMNGYVYASIPATKGRENNKAIGLIAHMDTAPAFSGENIKPRIIENYDGHDILLNKEENIVMETAVFPELKEYKGKTLIVTDGKTLLGADDKAGISEIMTAVEKIIERNLDHGPIRIAFTPDEEIGCSTNLFNVKEFGADYAYTVDGGALGELEYENFNAAGAKIYFHGNCIHPGEGINKIENSLLIAMEFNGMLSPAQTSSNTDGYEDSFSLLSCHGDEENTELKYLVTEYDRNLFEKKKAFLESVAEFLNKKYGKDSVKTEISDLYYNMKEQILPHMEIVSRAKEAMNENGVEAKIQSIRGCTDGSKLSFMGLPCPNLSTGGHNFHGKFEYIPVESMDKMTDILLTLVTK